VIIEARHNGPPGSGNGGYTAGLVAAAAGAPHGPLEVTLRVPPPLETPLSVVLSDGGLQVRDEDRLVAEARATPAPDAAVPAVPLGLAATAARAYPGLREHPFPTCYVCGPRRPDGDGLRIFPGPLPDGRTAAPWTVPADVSPATVWAALDCPGGWAVLAPGRPYVLGRITAVVRSVPRPGQRCVVVGAATASAGRKAEVDTSLYGPDGRLLAAARAVWIALPEQS